MSELIAIAYETPELALAGRNDVLRLGSAYLDDVGDAIIASVDGNGVIVLNQVVNLWSVAPKGTSLRSLIAGLLFVYPLLGVIDPDRSSAVSSALDELGLSAGALTSIREQLRPGQAVMFLWTSRHAPEALVSALGTNGTAQHLCIDGAKLPLVQSAFTLAHQEARKQRDTAYSGKSAGA